MSMEQVTPETLRRDSPAYNLRKEQIGAQVMNAAFDRRTAAIDEAVRRMTTQIQREAMIRHAGWWDNCIACDTYTLKIRAEFSRIMAGEA